jgi:phenylalanyl-tRNA synthetase alpha chain
MQQQLQTLQAEALAAIQTIDSLKSLDDLRVKYLGKKGAITALLANVGTLSAEQRPLIGKVSNEVKQAITAALDARKQALEAQEIAVKLNTEKIDITLPGRKIDRGHQHILTTTMNDIKEIFVSMGYAVAEGPDVEDDFHNFEALNIPKDHPSRDMHDTFYVQDGRVLRTHTSPVQIRLMENQKPPIKAIMPGRVYRCDADVTHSPVFHQVEALVVAEGITFGDLKGTLETLLHRMFGAQRRVRLRNSFFPFTEPSVEVDVECFMCGGKGCGLCKQTGWIEILGAGMVDPNVFNAVNIDPTKYTGFALGMGVERIAMLKYGINDIRLFYASDLRFLKQF